LEKEKKNKSVTLVEGDRSCEIGGKTGNLERKRRKNEKL
jgi:hypothetical protein